MRKIGMILNYFVTGMGFGAIACLCILTFVDTGTAPTPRLTFSVLILSGFIGILTVIFKTDLPIVMIIGIHLAGTFGAFIGMAWINHWQIGKVTLSIFAAVYVLIWLIEIIEQKQTVRQINLKIKDRQSSRNR